MVTLQQDIEVKTTVIEHWWRDTRREHRLSLRLLREKPEHLARLTRLDVIITKIDNSHLNTLREYFPNTVREYRSFLLSAERNFIECLRAIRAKNLTEATRYYNNAHDDLSLLQYMFMEQGIKTYI